jgi:hypothetical protein
MQRHHVIENLMILMESEDKNKLFLSDFPKQKTNIT